ncbi:MAG TPA: hypothetical protein PK332_11470, partial [Chitinophagales bacterium]|nr:hypothetical protein [Chitinophagales bacterium]
KKVTKKDKAKPNAPLVLPTHASLHTLNFTFRCFFIENYNFQTVQRVKKMYLLSRKYIYLLIKNTTYEIIDFCN